MWHVEITAGGSEGNTAALTTRYCSMPGGLLSIIHPSARFGASNHMVLWKEAKHCTQTAAVWQLEKHFMICELYKDSVTLCEILRFIKMIIIILCESFFLFLLCASLLENVPACLSCALSLTISSNTCDWLLRSNCYQQLLQCVHVCVLEPVRGREAASCQDRQTLCFLHSHIRTNVPQNHDPFKTTVLHPDKGLVIKIGLGQKCFFGVKGAVDKTQQWFHPKFYLMLLPPIFCQTLWQQLQHLSD